MMKGLTATDSNIFEIIQLLAAYIKWSKVSPGSLKIGFNDNINGTSVLQNTNN